MKRAALLAIAAMLAGCAHFPELIPEGCYLDKDGIGFTCPWELRG